MKGESRYVFGIVVLSISVNLGFREAARWLGELEFVGLVFCLVWMFRSYKFGCCLI